MKILLLRIIYNKNLPIVGSSTGSYYKPNDEHFEILEKIINKWLKDYLFLLYNVNKYERFYNNYK